MGEQERYKDVLKKVIDATENDKIKTSEELIQTLIYELTTTDLIKINKQKKQAHSQSLAN